MHIIRLNVCAGEQERTDLLSASGTRFLNISSLNPVNLSFFGNRTIAYFSRALFTIITYVMRETLSRKELVVLPAVSRESSHSVNFTF